MITFPTLYKISGPIFRYTRLRLTASPGTLAAAKAMARRQDERAGVKHVRLSEG